MASRGLCSRREAERLIESGHVSVDGVVVTEQGYKASLDAVIEIAAAGREGLAATFSVALHKPIGFVSTLPQAGQRAAAQLITPKSAFRVEPASIVRRVCAQAAKLAVAGRLDRASRGLLLLSGDGVVARALIGGNRVPKSYLVKLATEVTDGQIERLNRPMRLDERRLLPMKVERDGRDSLRLELVEGMKHQIRRCCGKVGLEVVDLFRDAIGPVRLGDLPEGGWRLLETGEVDALRATVVSSEQ